MDFDQYRKLKKLAFRATSFSDFLNEAARWPRRYGVTIPKIWTKADYQLFYDRIKGGHTYASIFNQATDTN